MFMFLAWWILRFGCGRFGYVFHPERPPCLHWLSSAFSTPPISSWCPHGGGEKNQQRMDRIRRLQKDVPPRFTASLIDFPPIASTLCLMDWYACFGCDVLVVAWHCKTWCTWCSSEPGDGFFNNRASTFSCNSKLCSRDSHGLKTYLVTRLLQCPYLHSSHDPQHCVCWTSSMCMLDTSWWAFDSLYVFFFSASFFFALIASTWHHMRTFRDMP